MFNDIILALITAALVVAVPGVGAQYLMFKLFNGLTRGLDDVKLLKGYTEPDGTKVPAHIGYRVYRGMLAAAHLMPIATLAYIPWGWKSHDWRPVLVWQIAFSFALIVILLVWRFGFMEWVVLRTENNLSHITRSNTNWAVIIVESTSVLMLSLVISGIVSGESREFWDGVKSSGFYIVASMLIMALWLIKALRSKKYNFVVDGVIVSGMSLSDGIKRGNYLAAVRAAGQVVFIGILLFGAFKGDFTNWTESIRISSITLVLSLLIALLLDKLWDRFLLHLEVNVDSESRLIVYTATSSLVLVAIALFATAVVTGAIASVTPVI